ncbi:hypothetical protein M0R19_05630 [Candidatus Pacearchaeota archaeon]|jgi:hypothetical protein|nr:hypothetical protein [Candidatus Pacearchaeota archaeon]
MRKFILYSLVIAFVLLLVVAANSQEVKKFTVTSRLDRIVLDALCGGPVDKYTYTTKEGFLVITYYSPLDGYIGKQVLASGSEDKVGNFIVEKIIKVEK